jgi:hypothetical protein
VGDVNKDTIDDFVICARFFASTLASVGACYIIYGGNNLQSMSMTNLGSGGIRIAGTIANQKLGQAVSAAGDVNKDGYADILMGCCDKKNVYLFYGGPSLINVDTTSGSFPGVIFPNPTTTSDNFGLSVSRAGDFNGDGIDDLMISSTSTTTNCQIYVVFGGSSLPTTFDLNTLTSSTGVRYFTGKSDAVWVLCPEEWISIKMGLLTLLLGLTKQVAIAVLLIWSLDRLPQWIRVFFILERGDHFEWNVQRE